MIYPEKKPCTSCGELGIHLFLRKYVVVYILVSTTYTAQKMIPANLVTFTEKFLIENFFFCAVLHHDEPKVIANAITKIGEIFQQKLSDFNIILAGLSPRELHKSKRRNNIYKVNSK